MRQAHLLNDWTNYSLVPTKISLLCICGIVILATTIEARKIRVRPRPQSLENEDSGVAEDIRAARVQYFAAEDPQEEQQQRIILVSEDDYNGLYGQPQVQAQARALQDNYIPHSRNAPKPQPQVIAQRTKGSTDAPKQPPVQTIRNYNKVNDDGSFTFGYEAADGSFKEETRGTDCVVRGKYGYVDPDGNKREFTYVSGNPCDPNAINDEDSDERRDSGSKSQQDDSDADTDDGQANYPKAFPVRPLRPSPSARPTPVPTRAPVTVFQNVYAQGSEEDEDEPLQVLQPQTPRPRLQPRPTPQYIARPQPSPTYQIQTESPRPAYHIQTESSRPSYQIQSQPTTPSALTFHHTNSPVNITPRPSTVKAQLPATTYRPQLVAVTPRPSQAALYTTKELEPAHRLFPSSTPTPITRTPSGTIDFQAEFAKFAAQDSNAVVSTPKTLLKSSEKVKPAPFQGSEPIYSSELVYDPSSGQYKTQLYQTLPQTTGDFSLSHRIQPYVHQQAQQPSRLVSLQQLQQQSPIYRTIPQQSAIPQQRPQPTQQLYQQQQAELQFQNSQQLYAQQQRARAQATQRPAPAPVSVQQQPQQFYYLQPSPQTQQHALAQGQIEAFLRGHNIDFK
ncbi:chromatin modification-related protein eaf-1-like [Chrysoperla carnea]|uniref:chromatin modification-related protein eaf-1-like n=1 Tax=Chrysoperla carnea TaxID=189513 RepID=UPI001D0902E8|nr:chromatin modification-related protein eaf-1-like [Chrysoperla carnea]